MRGDDIKKWNGGQVSDTDEYPLPGQIMMVLLTRVKMKVVI